MAYAASVPNQYPTVIIGSFAKETLQLKTVCVIGSLTYNKAEALPLAQVARSIVQAAGPGTVFICEGVYSGLTLAIKNLCTSKGLPYLEASLFAYGGNVNLAKANAGNRAIAMNECADYLVVLVSSKPLTGAGSKLLELFQEENKPVWFLKMEPAALNLEPMPKPFWKNE